jgi:hypothetical protein
VRIGIFRIREVLPAANFHSDASFALPPASVLMRMEMEYILDCFGPKGYAYHPGYEVSVVRGDA